MPRKDTALAARPDHRTAKRTGSVREQLVSAAVPYLPPWIAAATLPPIAGTFTHQMWGQEALSAGLACAGLGIGGATLSAITWAVAGGTNKFRRYRRVQATASMAAGMGWLTTATAAGPFVTGVLDSWLLGGALFAASWNVRQVMRNAHDETEEVETGGWSKLASAIGLEKFQLKNVKGNDKGVVTGEISVPAGKTVEDAQGAAPRLAAATQVPPAGVTITKDADDAGKAYLSLRVADVLKGGVEFIEPMELGLLPTEPIPCGLYADNEVMEISPFAADILQHMMVMGVTGAGKSEFARTILAHLATRRKMSTVLIDLSKGRQTVGHIQDGLEWLISDKKEAKRFLKALPAVIKARGDQLADEGLDQWAPKSKLNAMCVWIEEAADVADFEALEEIARAARSVGIWLVISLQRATWTNMSTDVRANLQAAACFGVDDAGDAGFCLPDRVTDSGAVPDWGSSRPGYAYATGMGIDPKRWTTEWRGSLTNREDLAELVADAAEIRDPLDEITANAFGLIYQQRTHRGTNRTNTAPTHQPAPTPHDDDTELDDLEDTMQLHEDDDAHEILNLIPDDPEPDADYASVRLEDDCPDADPPGIVTFETAAKPSTEEARRILEDQIDQWAHSNRLDFETGDLIPAAVQAGRTRGWLQNELKRLTNEGILNRTAHGEYSILNSPLVPA